MMTSPITPCLWFDGNAEEAARFYVSLFDNSSIGAISRYGKEGKEIHGRDEGDVLTVEFTLRGQPFTALNGGPQFTFDEAISFQIHVDTQAEIDRLWDKLASGGGKPGPCGWVKDRFGLSWQVVPAQMSKMLMSSDRAASDRAMKAMLKMGKLDIATLEAAYNGKAAA
jgi:predicted 3-demethylubiquinone-9 3-methyltransferase (glyoxalase superfamily)